MASLVRRLFKRKKTSLLKLKREKLVLGGDDGKENRKRLYQRWWGLLPKRLRKLATLPMDYDDQEHGIDPAKFDRATRRKLGK